MLLADFKIRLLDYNPLAPAKPAVISGFQALNAKIKTRHGNTGWLWVKKNGETVFSVLLLLEIFGAAGLF